VRPEENVMGRERRLERLLVGKHARRTRYAGTGRHTPGYSALHNSREFRKKKVVCFYLVLLNKSER